MRKNRFGGRLVAATLHQHIEHVAVLINGPPEIMQFASDANEYLASRAGESHPRALPEPYVTWSRASASYFLVQSRRNAKAAKRLLRKLLKRQCRPPRVMITDKLASNAAAKRAVMPSVEHRQHKGLTNRAENSHRPTRRRERIMNKFKSAGQAQRFLSVHDQVANLFRRPANTTATDQRQSRARAFTAWAEVTSIAVGF